MRDRRYELRVQCTAPVELRWKDQAGELQCRAAILVDISRIGACVQVAVPVPFGTLLSFIYENQELIGKVQHCTRKKTHYVMGIEFDSDHRWSRPAV